MDDQYSSYTALLYVFNLIVGTGALTLPKAFFEAGWLLSSIMITVLAFMSYMTVTFVIEAISRCHSITQWERVERMRTLSRSIRNDCRYYELCQLGLILSDIRKGPTYPPPPLAIGIAREKDIDPQAIEPDNDDDDEAYDSTEDSLMLPPEFIENFPSQPQRMFTLDVKVELSTMANTVFNQYGRILFYICLCVYLYGDLTIYSAAVAKSLLAFCDTNETLSCVKVDNNETSPQCDPLCWGGYNFTVSQMYKIYLGCFLLLFGPYVFFNVQKTKILQVITSVSRWLTFLIMIGLAIWRLSSPSFQHGDPLMVKWYGIPALFGSSIYSFMCHHSLPGLIAPIENKKNLFAFLAFDYIVILIFYITLGLTAIFAFPWIDDLYPLNFAPSVAMSEALKPIGYVLALFPAYTLTASFPIIAVTLRGNLQAMFVRFPWRFLHCIILPIVAAVPPVIIAMSTTDVEVMVCITGSFAGVAIQYIIPATIVMLSRIQTPPALVHLPNPYASPFRSMLWPCVVLLWAIVCYALVLFDLFKNRKLFGVL